MTTLAEARRPKDRSDFVNRLSRSWVDGLMSTITGATYVFLLAPIVVVIVFSFSQSASGYTWTGFTLNWYRELVESDQLLHALRVSLTVGFSAATGSVALGLMAAFAMARRRFVGKKAFTGMVLMPLIVPELVLATSLLILLTRGETQLGYSSLILGHVIITLPYAALIQFAGVARLSPEVEEAAADLGAHPRSVMLLVVIPQVAPAMLTAFVFAFLISFDDIVMSTFLSGVGSTTMPVHVYSMLKLGVSPVVNALGTVLVAITLVLMVSTGVRQATIQLR